MVSKLKVIGLTGGIASGKTVVARVFKEHGIPVIDADAIGHLVLEPGGGAHAEVLEAFGPGILESDGRTIDRRALGRLVFDDGEARAKLETITHPAISALAGRGLAAIEERGYRFAVYEAALLVETGMNRSLDGLVLVAASVANQLARLRARDGLAKEDAAARIASQLPLAEKMAVADHVIRNDGTLDELRARAAEVAALLARLHGPKPS